MLKYSIVECSLAEHGEAILAILNEAIETSTALYDYKPRTMLQMQTWFEAKRESKFPVIGLVSHDGILMGFASLSAFRPQPAYKYTAEHSVYVHRDFRGEGLGEVLVEEVLKAAQSLDLHAVIGVIDSTNASSIALHEKLGFTSVGTLPEVGFKFGDWLTVVLYQKTLGTPLDPVDG